MFNFAISVYSHPLNYSMIIIYCALYNIILFLTLQSNYFALFSQNLIFPCYSGNLALKTGVNFQLNTFSHQTQCGDAYTLMFNLYTSTCSLSHLTQCGYAYTLSFSLSHQTQCGCAYIYILYSSAYCTRHSANMLILNCMVRLDV